VRFHQLLLHVITHPAPSVICPLTPRTNSSSISPTMENRSQSTISWLPSPTTVLVRSGI
jgi:hypothetical protein